MKINQSLTAFFRRWRWALCSAAVLLLSVILLFLFPRKEYLAVSTALAILFWLAIAAVIVCIALAVRNRRKPLRGKPVRQNKTI